MNLIEEIRACVFCSDLPLGPKPLIQFSRQSKLLIVGQAPGVHAHNSGIPWNDASGIRLRSWLGLSEDDFYDPKITAIVPMGFCYPGKGPKGDLPPRKECQAQWMETILSHLKKVQLKVLIGQYAITYFLGKKTLEEQIRSFHEGILVLPHPSPLNNIWLSKNRWFENEIVPQYQKRIKKVL